MDTEIERLFGSFQGADLEPVACEALLFSRWESKERNQEAGLFMTKWWDVRTLHPVIATYLFAHLYTERVRHIIRNHLNNAPASVSESGAIRDWHPIKAGDIFDPPTNTTKLASWRRKILGVIRARQAADANGIPYQDFINAGLDHFYFGAGTYVLARRSGLMPEPNLLYGDACLAVIREKWVEQIQISVRCGLHKRYRVENDDGHPDMNDHRKWLEDQITLRARPEFARRRLIEAGLLR